MPSGKLPAMDETPLLGSRDGLGIADLHSHLPMHIAPTAAGVRYAPGLVRDRWRHVLVSLVGRFGNLEGAAKTPRVSTELLSRGGVRIALSVLYLPLDEMVFSPQWHLWELRRRERRFHWAPPSRTAFNRLLRQLESVERHVAGLDRVVVVRGEEQLDRALEGGRIALVHCVEGAFHLSHAPSVDRAVAELARRGVAYITIGHLFFRSVATVAPSWATISERRWNALWPQPDIGLTEAARAVIRAMVREGVLVDLTHLSTRALEETFELLDELDPRRRAPVLVSHGALRFGELEYNLSPQTVERIAARDGVIGLIASAAHLRDGTGEPPPVSFEQTKQLLFRHLDRLRELTGSHRHAAIGTDLGGFISPAPGLENAACLAHLRGALTERYGEADAELICSANVIRLLRSRWRAGSGGSPPPGDGP